jgi:hypothetical protein
MTLDTPPYKYVAIGASYRNASSSFQDDKNELEEGNTFLLTKYFLALLYVSQFNIQSPEVTEMFFFEDVVLSEYADSLFSQEGPLKRWPNLIKELEARGNMNTAYDTAHLRDAVAIIVLARYKYDNEDDYKTFLQDFCNQIKSFAGNTFLRDMHSYIYDLFGMEPVQALIYRLSKHAVPKLLEYIGYLLDPLYAIRGAS